MVILVPFLLITAVFSRTTILEIQPTAKAEAENTESALDPLQLLVTVREAVIEVSYSELEQPKQFKRLTDGRELESLASLAGDLKARYPQSLEATVLLEPQIPYDVLVQVLDALRIRLHGDGSSVEQEELFPLIALGPASPVRPTGVVAP